jgi:uncharacterized protein YsxB (DUF464 family)
MIVITMKSKENKFSVTGKGHAAYNPGQDIVCSAVSCLFYAFAGYLINREDIKCKYRLDSGDSEIEAEGNVKECFEMLKIGLMQIEDKYPKFVKVVLT